MTIELKDKLHLGKVLTEGASAMPPMFAALSDPIRMRAVAALLKSEGEGNELIAFSDLRLALGNIESNKLTYHLRKLQEAGFIRNITQLPTGKDENRSILQRSFYKTTALVGIVLRWWLGNS